MLNRLRRLACGTVILAATCGAAAGGPPTAEEVARQKAVVDALAAAMSASKDESQKVAALEAAVRDRSVDLRRRVVELAENSLARDADGFFKSVLEKDLDAGIRGQAATSLGRVGSPQSIPALAAAANADPVTGREIGCILTRGTARREAIFALADLAGRFPKSADAVAGELRKLAPQDPSDGDAVRAALFRVTRDPELLAPVVKQLADPAPARRRDAVVQLRFFDLKAAPPELVARLDDADAEVQSWAALTLGEVGDAATAPALLAAAADAKRDKFTRCNAIVSLARLNAPGAEPTLRRLRDDPDEAVRAQAAAALGRITSKDQPPQK